MTIGKSSRPDNRRSPATPSSAEPVEATGSEFVEPEFAEPQDAAPSIGRILAEARLAAGLTVDEVSAGTRVRVPIVHAIEQDDFSRCGGDFYARGHIRSIAKAVGADGDALVARFAATHAAGPVLLAPVAPIDARRIRAGRGRPNWTTAMVAAILAVVVLIGFNLLSGKPGRPSAGAGSAALPSAAASVSASHSPSPSPSPSSQSPAPSPSGAPIAAAPADKVTVKLVAEGGSSWISAADGSGNSLFQNNLDQGQDQTFTDAKQIKLVIGNAAAVHLYVNGKDLGPAGQDGQVVHLTYTPGDPQAG